VAGWLHTEISVLHRELNPDTIVHLSINRDRRGLTSLIEANALRQASLKVFVLQRLDDILGLVIYLKVKNKIIKMVAFLCRE